MRHRHPTRTPAVRLLFVLCLLVASLGFANPGTAQISGELEGFSPDFRRPPVNRPGGCSAGSTEAAPPLAGLLLLLLGLARRR